MRCSVVIPCHGGVELTRDCLASLLAQSGDHELEILVVDNASRDGTADLGATHASVRVLRQPSNLGFAGGVNAGLRAARFPFALVLNNDTQAATNLLDELFAAIDSDPRIGAVAPVSNFVKGPAGIELGNAARDAAVRADVARTLQTGAALQDVDTLAGLCLLLRRDALDVAGTFDERFGHGNYEDDDLCLRLRLHGYRLVIARRAFLHHEGHATFRALGLAVPDELHKRRAQFRMKWLADPAGRAVLAAASGQLAAAAAEADAARKVWPQWPDADWHCGRLAAASGDHMQARRHFRALLDACPNHTDASIELALGQLATGNASAAQRQLQWTASHCHVATDVQRDLSSRIGEYWHGRRNWGAALQSFDAALEIDATHGGLHNWRGSCLLERGDIDAADAAFDTATRHDCPLAWTNRGICAHRRGDNEAALEHFRTANRLLPDDAVAQANLAALERQLAVVAGHGDEFGHDARDGR